MESMPNDTFWIIKNDDDEYFCSWYETHSGQKKKDSDRGRLRYSEGWCSQKDLRVCYSSKSEAKRDLDQVECDHGGNARVVKVNVVKKKDDIEGPAVGTVYYFENLRSNPFIVSRHVEDEIVSVNSDGDSVAYGSFEDFQEEVDCGRIVIVHDPRDF